MSAPQLRFKGFRGDWNTRNISEVLQRVSRPVDVEPNQNYREIGIRSHGKGIFHKEPVTGASLGDKRVFWVDENLFVLNIVFAWEQAVAMTTATEKGMVASHRFPMYAPKSNLSVPDYILRFFLTAKGKHLLGLASPGGAGRNKTLGQKNFEELSLTLPSPAEQTKIANFLTAVDERIAQLIQKCDLLAQYKKGVMQKIFSQELRFKDDKGREFPEWEEVALEQIANFYRGGALSKSDIDPTGEYDCIHYGELFTIYNEVIRIIKSRTNKSDLFQGQVGDILMPSSDVTPAGLAKACCLTVESVGIGGDINIIRMSNGDHPEFISYLLNFEKAKIIQMVSGTTVKHIYIKDTEV